MHHAPSSTTSMAFESGTAYPESDADDEYERSVHAGSPVLATDDEDESEEEGGEGEGDDGREASEHTTPTTYGGRSGAGGGGGDQLPETIVTEWTAEECVDFVGSLGLRQYAEQFLGM